MHSVEQRLFTPTAFAEKLPSSRFSSMLFEPLIKSVLLFGDPVGRLPPSRSTENKFETSFDYRLHRQCEGEERGANNFLTPVQCFVSPTAATVRTNARSGGARNGEVAPEGNGLPRKNYQRSVENSLT